MLYVNLFADGDALLECDPQGDAFISLMPAPEDAEAVVALLTSAEVSATLFRAGFKLTPDRSRNQAIAELTPTCIATGATTR